MGAAGGLQGGCPARLLRPHSCPDPGRAEGEQRTGSGGGEGGGLACAPYESPVPKAHPWPTQLGPGARPARGLIGAVDRFPA